jgi:hypothetical protein
MRPKRMGNAQKCKHQDMTMHSRGICEEIRYVVVQAMRTSDFQFSVIFICD